MTKIVYNADFGGFSLSRKAVLRAREISGDPHWGGACIKGDFDKVDGSVYERDYGFIEAKTNGQLRTDPVLVQVVEELGEEANGRNATLAICELEPGTKYRIDEYDGA